MPRVFLGAIASSGTLLKDPVERDRLREQFSVRAVEMEASGIAHYRRLPSLREYVLVSHLTPRIEVWRKNESNRWELAQEACAGEQAELASVACALPVDEVYADPLAQQA